MADFDDDELNAALNSAEADGDDADDFGDALAEADDDLDTEDEEGGAEAGDEGVTDAGDDAEDGDEDDTDAGDDAEEGTDASAGDTKADDGGDTKPIMVPKSRMDSALNRARAAEAALQEERASKSDPEPEERPDYDAKLTELNEAFAKALDDGDSKEAARLNLEMQSVIHERATADISDVTKTATSAARESAMVDALVDELVAANPELDDSNTEAFNQQLVNDVEDLRDVYEARGLTPSQALARAIETRFPEGLERIRGAGTPAAQDTQEPPAKRKTDVAKKVEAAGKQPPDINNSGTDSPSHGIQGKILDINKLTDDQLDNLSDEQWDDMLGNHG